MKNLPVLFLLPALLPAILLLTGCDTTAAPTADTIPPVQQTSADQGVKVSVAEQTPVTTTAPATAPSPAITAQKVDLMSDAYKLHGYLWKPAGNGPFPAIIYNHGSEQNPSIDIPLYNYFVSKGFVIFLTDRRGHGDSEGPYEGDVRAAAPVAQKNQVTVEQFQNQVDDVEAGLNYVKSLAYVDQNKLALMGCSYGGIMSLLTNENSLGIKATVDFAGDSESWDDLLLRKTLLAAVDNAKSPVYFLQAQNDYHTEPSLTFSAEMNKVGKENVMKIYPAYGTTPAQGHGGFCSGATSVWGDDVTAFLNKYLH